MASSILVRMIRPSWHRAVRVAMVAWLLSAFCLFGETYYDVLSQAERAIDAQYPAGSIANQTAKKDLQAINDGKLSEEEKIRSIRRKFLQTDVKELRRQAEQGNAQAQFNLGECYYDGNGVSEDMTEAAKWYRKAAEQGLADAQFNLGTCYRNGYGVKKNPSEAAKWYRKAAEQGHAKAQYFLGLCYLNDDGLGVKKNPAEAVKWFRKAAEQEDAKAQYFLGLCYYNGLGVKKNPAEAVKWFRKAAEQGDTLAQMFLKELAP